MREKVHTQVCKCWGEGQREKESQAGSTISAGLKRGFDLKSLESRSELKSSVLDA